MRSSLLSILLVLFCAFNVQSEVIPSQGFSRTWEKLAKDKALTIGYFGGSITEGAGASNAGTTSWRALTTKWFRDNFPEAQITEVNAAIGGTGSDLGAFRCERDLLSKKPDLVFVEFAVNDNGVPEATRAKYFEGVIRQIKKANPAGDIIVVFTATKATDTYAKDVLPVTVAYQQKIADHYGLPTVNIGKALALAIKEGPGTWETFTVDNTHPSDAGYKLYADTVAEFLTARRTDSPSAAPTLPDALHTDVVDNASMIDAWTLDAPGWTKEEVSLAGRFPHRLSSDKPGTELVIPFHGTGIGLYWLIAPDSGIIEYQIDNGPTETLSSWDKHALKFTRAGSRVLTDSLSPGDHVLRIKISDQKDEQSTGHAIRIGAFLVKG